MAASQPRKEEIRMVDAARNEYTDPATGHSQPADAAGKHPAGGTEPTKVYSLVKHLIDDAALLVRKELALAASEVNRSVKDTRKGMSGLLSGAVVLNAGFLFLLAAATFGLAQVMQPWMAALLVGIVTTVVGLIMVTSGKKKLEPSSFKPERAMEEVRKDKASVRGVTS